MNFYKTCKLSAGWFELVTDDPFFLHSAQVPKKQLMHMTQTTQNDISIKTVKIMVIPVGAIS